MLARCDLIAFVNTARPKQAKAFYQKTLGLTLVSDDPFALVFDANGTSLRVSKAPKVDPAPHTVVGWKVSDITRTVTGLRKKRVRFSVFPGMEQDKLGIWTAPGGARVAWFKDADGNLLSLTQF